MVLNLIGPTYQSSSVNADAERAINLYPESVESGSGKNSMILIGTPGLVDFSMLPTSPVRGLWAGEERLFVVAGSKLYELSSTGTIIGLGGPTDNTARGDVGTDSVNSPVQIFPNGEQLLIISAGFAYVDNGTGPAKCTYPYLNSVVFVSGTSQTSWNPQTGAMVTGIIVTWVSGDYFDPKMVGQPLVVSANLSGSPAGLGGVVVFFESLTAILVTPITFPPEEEVPSQYLATFTCSPAVVSANGAFLDGYFIVSTPNTKQINISSIDDGTTWSNLDFAVKEGYPDNIAALLADHEELYILGTQTSEVWQDTGAADFPLQRNPGAFIPIGCVAPNSPARIASGVIWLGGDTRGGPVAYYAAGFVPARVSNHAIEAQWNTYSTIIDAEGFVYRDAGHEFWVLTFPTANATWVYDGVTGMWHERGVWNAGAGTLTKVPYRGHCYVWNQHFTGDWTSGQVYTMSLQAYDYAGTPISRVRIAPPRSGQQISPYTSAMTGQEFWTFFQKLQLDYEAGLSNSVTVTLDWSDDGGHTYGQAFPLTGDAVGNYTYRAIWRRLGKSRDRVFRITVVSTAKVALIGAYLQSVVGTG